MPELVCMDVDHSFQCPSPVYNLQTFNYAMRIERACSTTGMPSWLHNAFTGKWTDSLTEKIMSLAHVFGQLSAWKCHRFSNESYRR
ncbi:hypothetical protein KP509_25G021800 [Ceratopteris richardii]|uniref:Uncharacterized protein n=1 Tax=Ceratopteris richardii TaxID=49495 RepID=A0A8T2RNA3_CERRI|nr:hypothetical protein KP509_25G021800 [Ceratopteris richardii]